MAHSEMVERQVRGAMLQPSAFTPERTLERSETEGLLRRIVLNWQKEYAAWEIMEPPKNTKHTWLGTNSRLDELQAAFLSRKLTRLDEDNARRRVIARYYTENIRKDRFALPYSDAQLIGEDHVFHIFPLRSPQRTELQSHLSQAGIETLIHYPVPVHWQECFFGRIPANLHFDKRKPGQPRS